MGFTRNFHGKKGGPENFWGLKGGPRKIFVMKFFCIRPPPYKCLWTVPKCVTVTLKFHVSQTGLSQIYHFSHNNLQAHGTDKQTKCKHWPKILTKMDNFCFTRNTGRISTDAARCCERLISCLTCRGSLHIEQKNPFIKNVNKYMLYMNNLEKNCLLLLNETFFTIFILFFSQSDPDWKYYQDITWKDHLVIWFY